MKKRLVLCAIALALSLGAMATSSRPAYACVSEPDCDPWDCQDFCAAQGRTGVCSICTGRCNCV
jgi:hypothetical protein